MKGLQLWDLTPEPLIPITRGIRKVERANKYLLDGKLQTFKEVSEEYGMSLSFLQTHISAGLSMDEVVEEYWWKMKGVKLYAERENGYETVHEPIPTYVEQCIDNRGFYIFV